jgi:hypothetical protein
LGFFYRAIELLHLGTNLLDIDPQLQRLVVADALGLERTSERSPHSESLSELPANCFNARKLDRAMARRVMAAQYGFQLPLSERWDSGGSNGGHGVGHSSPHSRPPPRRGGTGRAGSGAGGGYNLGNQPGPRQGGGVKFGPQGSANVPCPPPGESYHVYDDYGNRLYSFNENGVIAPQNGTKEKGTRGSL